MKPTLAFIFFLFSITLSNFSIAQSRINSDSLENLLSTSLALSDRIDILIKLSQFYAEKNPDSALEYINEVLSYINDDSQSVVWADAYVIKGDILLHIGQNREAQLLYEQALAFARKNNNLRREAAILIDLGQIWRKIGEYENAHQNYREAIAISESIKDSVILSQAYNSQGYLFKVQSRYQDALECLLEGLNLIENSDHFKLKASLYSNIGEVYDLHIADYEAAIFYHEKALALRQKSNDLRGVCISTRNIGALERRKGNYTNAITYLEQSLQLAESIQYNTMIASIYYHLGYVYKDLGDPKVAIQYAERSISIHKAANNYMGYFWSRLLQGEIELALQNYEKAFQYGNETYQLSLESRKSLAVAQSSELLSDIYYQKKDFEKAYEYYEIFKQKSDEFNFGLRVGKEAVQNMKEKYEKKTKELLEDQKRKQLAYKYKQQQTAFAYTGAFFVFVLVFFYITNRNKRQANDQLLTKNRELNEAREIAEAAAAAKQNFLAMISHEIRTPMNAVIGFTDLLLEETQKPQHLSHLKHLKFSTEQLLSLMNDLLDYSKIESQQLSIEKVNFDCLAVIEELVESYRQTKQNDAVHLLMEVNETSFSRYLNGDQVRLKQILINLIDNALKFTPQGSIWIRVWTVQSKIENTVKLHIEVEDTGIGISEEDQLNVFESFTQVGVASTRSHGGTGLGLSICKHLVEMQNGELFLESQVGKGSKFSFYIPYQIAKDIERNPQTTTTKGVFENLLIFKGIEVLIVEDNLLNQKILFTILEKWGMKPFTVSNGADAVHIVENRKFDLIMMDLFMPDMSGIEATTAIRALNSDHSDIPIIAITASILEDIDQEAYTAGINYVIGKPFQKAELQYIIQQALNLSVIP